jgi:hypothetical protein
MMNAMMGCFAPVMKRVLGDPVRMALIPALTMRHSAMELKAAMRELISV